MIENIYSVSIGTSNHTFFFVSSGPNGDFLKVAEFEHTRKNLYNLRFGDYPLKGTNDSVISNNHDWRKIMETIAFCVVEFTDYFPEARIGFTAVDSKRASLYNYVFRKKQDKIENLFDVEGIYEGKLEKFNPKHFYQTFLIERKN